jgi:hypothetical protein
LAPVQAAAQTEDSDSSKNISSLNPYLVTGLIDAEGYFTITIHKSDQVKIGWRVKPNFEIGLNIKDKLLLIELQNFFGGIGTFKLDKKANAIKYSVADLNDINNIVIPHFKKYQLFAYANKKVQIFYFLKK